MARGTKKVIEKLQDKYVEARLAGNTKQASAKIAGYAPTTKESQIEKPGSPAHEKIIAALAARGLDESYLAGAYAKGIPESITPKGKTGDYNAYFKGLLQLGYLLGHGKRDTPAALVQINTGGGLGLDPERSAELLERVEAVCKALEARAGDVGLRGVHEGVLGDEDPGACEGMGEPAPEPQELGGGGGA